MEHQNWGETVLGGKSKCCGLSHNQLDGRGKKNKKQRNRDERAGKGGNHQIKSTAPLPFICPVGGAGKKMHRILEDDDNYVGNDLFCAYFPANTVSFSFKVALQKARQAKGLSQKDLASRINEKQSTI